MDFQKEYDFLVSLVQALEYIVGVCEQHPQTYPMLIADIVTLIHGRVVEDEEGNKYLINGLEEQIEEMYETLVMLEEELRFEAPSFVYPSDYSI